MPIPGSGEDLQRISAKNYIYESVCRWIITGVLHPGEKVIDSELAKYFNVSRTPVREALQMLEAQKLVSVIPSRGTVVTELDIADIEKAYRPLAELQGLAAELAADRIDDAGLAALSAVLDEFKTACLENRADAAIALDNRFHELILEAADSEYLVDFSRTLILHIQRIKYHYFHSDRLRKASVEQHTQILAVICAHDGKKAHRLMREHWLSAMERSLREVYKQQSKA